MLYRVILTAVLLLAITQAASAVCFGIQEYPMHCEGPGGCEMDTFVAACVPGGSWGNFCTTGYGECCGQVYQSNSVTGSCFCVGYGCQGKQSPKPKKDLLAEDKIFLATSSSQPVLDQPAPLKRNVEFSSVREMVLNQLLYIPDKCAGVYGAFIPE